MAGSSTMSSKKVRSKARIGRTARSRTPTGSKRKDRKTKRAQKRTTAQASGRTGASIAPSTANVVPLQRRRLRKEFADLESNKHLKRVYEQIRELLKKDLKRGGLARYEIGARVRKVKDDPKKYGKNAVLLLSSLLGLKGDTTLYGYARVAETWSRNQVEQLLARPTPRGVGISFSHLVALSNVKKDDYRKEMLAKAISQGWSHAELELELNQGARAVNVAAFDGPPELRPFWNAIKQWETEAELVEERTTKLKELAAEHRSEQALALLNDAVAEQRKLATTINKCAEELERHREALATRPLPTEKVPAPGKSRRQARAL
jgi:hypothetical protein